MHNPGSNGPLTIVGLGASAGGLQAFTEFLDALPAATGMAFVVIQHLAAEHESMLAQILARSTPMRVIEVSDEPFVELNTIYVIPPNRSMLIANGKLKLAERAPGTPRSIDIFLTALAESLGHRAIGVVLSGTGNDGMLGMEAIKAGGGITFAQDKSAQHSGMPQSAIDSGCVDFILPPREIALELARLAASPEVFGNDVGSASEGIEAILDVIRQTLKVDFSQYKPNTLQRRIRRRMALQRAATLEDYKSLLQGNRKEVEALHQDILISVTNFFRNPESFEALKQTALPRLFDREKFDDPLRIWVLGCSTGEEAYSLGILLQECMLEVKKPVPVVIFATDINNTAIERARRAWYPKTIERDVSQERLARFFTEVDDGYCVGKSTRDLCVFARHNGFADPPFSRIDLVSCRNMLIYLQAGLQRRLLPMLHYALKPQGILFLGPSETISHNQELFDVEDVKHKIYTKRATQRRLDTTMFPVVSPSGAMIATHAGLPFGAAVSPPSVDLQRELERALLKHYVPASVVVTEDGEVLQFRGDVDLYVALGEGKASLNLLKIAREGLLAPLRAILQRLKNREEITREEGVMVKAKDGLMTISLQVISVSGPDAAQRCHCILFEPYDAHQPQAVKPPPRRRMSKAKYIEEADRQLQVLAQELAATREYLESTIEFQQASNEELQSANEEVQSTNEELQSTNEELETSKEEIQSSNEELTTVNEELRNRNDDLDRANDDLNNLFGSVQMAVVMVWRDLSIRRFTPLAQIIFNLVPTDIGRSIANLHSNLELPAFSRLLEEVIEQGVVKENEVRSRDGHSYLLRIRPYRTEGNQVDGAVIVLIDIDILARTQESLRKRVEELATADRNKSEFLAILGHELRNPLAPLRNAAQILKLSPTNEDVSAKARDLIERQVKHMSRMVNDLLDTTRAERGQIKLQLEQVDLRAIAQSAADSTRPQFEARRQELRIHVPPQPVWVDGDPARLDQMVSNLLSNANKYTGERGTIEVRVEPPDPRSSEPPQAVLRVRDDGEGIDSDLIPRIFELFTQADRSLAHSQGGLGIGLNLVRTLTEMHKGTVTVHSDGLNLGSEFVIRIPALAENQVAVSDALEGAPAMVEESMATHQRILIVDDNVDINESSEILLTYAGHQVKTASTGQQALEVAASFEPTVILLDIGLPDMDGYEVARRLRQIEGLALVRLIAVSGYDTPEARSRSAAAGCDHHLAKPLNLSALEALLLT